MCRRFARGEASKSPSRPICTRGPRPDDIARIKARLSVQKGLLRSQIPSRSRRAPWRSARPSRRFREGAVRQPTAGLFSLAPGFSIARALAVSIASNGSFEIASSERLHRRERVREDGKTAARVNGFDGLFRRGVTPEGSKVDGPVEKEAQDVPVRGGDLHARNQKVRPGSPAAACTGRGRRR